MIALAQEYSTKQPSEVGQLSNHPAVMSSGLPTSNQYLRSIPLHTAINGKLEIMYQVDPSTGLLFMYDTFNGCFSLITKRTGNIEIRRGIHDPIMKMLFNKRELKRLIACASRSKGLNISLNVDVQCQIVTNRCAVYTIGPVGTIELLYMIDMDNNPYTHLRVQLQTRNCFECGTPGIKGTKANQMCTGCNMCYYCSKECQKRNWKQHRDFCQWSHKAK